MELGQRETGSAILGRVGSGHSRVSVLDSTFSPVFSFNMRVYRGVVSIQSNTISANHKCLNVVKSGNVVTSRETETAD